LNPGFTGDQTGKTEPVGTTWFYGIIYLEAGLLKGGHFIFQRVKKFRYYNQKGKFGRQKQQKFPAGIYLFKRVLG